MATFASSITQIKASNIDLNDKIYLAKSGDTIAYSLKMSELIKNIRSNIIPSIKDYNYYTGNTQNIQQKFGFSATDTSQKFWDALANNVVHGNASRIQYGDIVYMPVTWNNVTVSLWQVVDINRYGNDLIFRPYASASGGSGLSFGEIAYNSSGSSTMGWSGSNIRSMFNGYSGISKIPASTPVKTAGLNKAIAAACSGHLRKISRNLAKYNNGWNSLEKVIDYAFLPTEKEILGTTSYQMSSEGGERFKLFQLGHKGYYTSSYTWTCSPRRGGTDDFALVFNDGNVGTDYAGNTNYVCPCWCFGIGN